MPDQNRNEQITNYYNSLKSPKAKLKFLMNFRYRHALRKNLGQDTGMDEEIIDRLTGEFFVPKKKDGTYDIEATDKRMGMLIDYMYDQNITAGRRYQELLTGNEPLISMQPDEESKEKMARYLTNTTSRGNMTAGLLDSVMINVEKNFTGEHSRYFAEKYRDLLASDDAAYLSKSNAEFKSEPTFFNIYALRNTKKVNDKKISNTAEHKDYETGVECGTNESYSLGSQFAEQKDRIYDFKRQRAEYFLSEPEPFSPETKDRKKAIVAYAKSIEHDERALIRFWIDTVTGAGVQSNNAEPVSIITEDEDNALTEYLLDDFLTPKLPNGQPDTDTFDRRFKLIGKMRGENNIKIAKRVRELEKSDNPFITGTPKERYIKARYIGSLSSPEVMENSYTASLFMSLNDKDRSVYEKALYEKYKAKLHENYRNAQIEAGIKEEEIEEYEFSPGAGIFNEVLNIAATEGISKEDRDLYLTGGDVMLNGATHKRLFTPEQVRDIQRAYRVDSTPKRLHYDPGQVFAGAIANRNRIKAISNTMVTLNRASDQMASHTAFKFMNSAEYNRLIDSFSAFNDKYLKFRNGQNQYGNPLKYPEKGPLDEEMEALIEEARKMKKAAKDYIDAKAAQKGGGIDRHMTKQGKDRLAFANLVAEFDLDALTTDRNLNQNKQHENKKRRIAEIKKAREAGMGRAALDGKKAELSAKAKQKRQSKSQNVAKGPKRRKEAPKKPARGKSL